jgi:hypothetical protein
MPTDSGDFVAAAVTDFDRHPAYGAAAVGEVAG